MSAEKFQELDVEKILAELKEAVSRATNEEEFKINAERILYDNVISKLGLKPGRYEYTFISGGRADALYGHLIIEYKAPGKLNRDSDIAKAKEQLIGYIIKESQGVEERYRSFLGVILCDKIAFVRYNFKEKKWDLRGPFELNKKTILKLVEAIRGLRRKRLVVEEILKDFGPNSNVTKRAIRVFYNKLLKSKNPKVRALYDDWLRLFSQVCAYKPEKLKGLEHHYGLAGDINYSALLFSIHTYYAFFMKLLAAEIAYLYGAGRFLKSYIAELENAYMQGLESFKDILEELESGGVFRDLLNIINFIEGGYFSWYLEELDSEVAKVLYDVAKVLSDYEPATPILEPEYARDLLKRLYQNLVPRNIRHKLGEYYTPDWLAELTLDEAGYTVENFEAIAEKENDPLAPLKLRLLDPACGSGTFLVLAIKRLKEYAERHYLTDILVSYLLENIVGYDLNPLAVLAARTNYLLMIADIMGYLGKPIEIPIYLADSLLIEARTTLQGNIYVLRTSVGEFQLPKSIVDKKLLGPILNWIDKCTRDGKYSPEEFKALIKKKFKLEDNKLYLISELFKIFLKLEKEGKNHVWTSIIRNAFAPLLKGKFDFVVGNPPWINWENLPGQYRELTKPLWNIYGLLERTKGLGLGKVKRDIAMLFIARCLDLYTKDKGKFAFLAPYTLFKTQAGAGFRKYLSLKCRVVKIHDLVTLYPFEGAVNRTSLIVIEKDKTTKFPIPCTMWYNPRAKGVEQDLDLIEVKKITKQFNLSFIPIEINNPMSPWMEITEKAYKGIKKLFGKSPWYRAYEGVNTALNQVYWIEVLSKTPEGLLITNPSLPGQKKKVKQVKQVIEKDLVYPLIRGRDVKKWYATQELGYILLPVDKGKTISHHKLKTEYPQTWKYFSNFVKDLVSRGGEPYKSKLKPYREKKFDIAEKISPPFYWLFNVEPSLSSYKVVWKRIAGSITGKAVSFASAVLEPVRDKFVGLKPIILNDAMILVPLKDRDEAYYLSGVLNSSITLLAIASYTYELRQETHITRYIKIPKFDPSNPLHRKISDLSKKAHEITKKIYEEKREELKEDLMKIENEIDDIVAKLYEITDEELYEIKKCLKILKEGEVEDEIREEVPKVNPDISIGNPVVKEDEPFNLEVIITNLTEKPIYNVKVKVEILDKTFEKLINKLFEKYIWIIPIGKLKCGEYQVRLFIEYLLNGKSIKIEKTVPLYVKSTVKRVIRRIGFEDLF